MKRNIIRIDESLCDGCGLCASACAEGAIRIVDGKARLVSEIYCDGLGACIGECPRDAIIIEERDAAAFDEKAVHEHLRDLEQKAHKAPEPLPCGCPGSSMRSFDAAPECIAASEPSATARSELTQWPVQLMLVPESAPFLAGRDILVCADCAPLALPDFHQRYLKNRAVLIGCPKLDDIGYYQEKLTGMFRTAAPSSITVLRMEVPCCGGIARAALAARNEAAPRTPFDIVTVGIRGSVTKESVEPAAVGV